MDIQTIRKQYPDYADLSDQELADKLHKAFYADIGKQDFYSRIGLNVPSAKAQAMADEGVSGVVEGIMDPLHGGAQLLEHALPESISSKISEFNNWLREKPGFGWLAEVPEGGLDEYMQTREQAIQLARKQEGDEGIDWDRMLGNVISPANLAVSARAASLPAAAAKSLAPRVGVGAGVGGVTAALQPVSGGDYATEKVKQVGLGTVAGGAVPAAGGAVARVIQPKVNKSVTALKREGVVPTVGAAVGPGARKLEDAATSIPVLGDAILSAKERSLIAFNRAAANRVLRPIGETVPKSVQAGRTMADFVHRKVSDHYQSLLPKLKGELDWPLKVQLANLERMATKSTLSPTAKNQIKSIINQEIRAKFTQHGKASGETLKAIEQTLGTMASKMAKSADYDQNQVGRAVKEMQRVLRRMIERKNPAHRGALKKTNTAWANLKVFEDASSRAGTGRREGVFFPHQLSAASRSARDSTKASTARGQNLMQDLAENAEGILPSTVPDSGTPRRLISDLALMGGAYAVNPKALIGLGLGAMPYAWGPLQRGMTHAFTSRPGFAQPVADAVRQFSPLLAPAGSPLLYPPK